MIETEANLNSKSQFRRNRLTRLVIEVILWEAKKAAKVATDDGKADNG